ncbi:MULTISPECIES: transposase [Paenibacillus]|uniref:transposase n=1 Tax=Paenibacillus TaxID=44249 RepID=UPI0033402354
MDGYEGLKESKAWKEYSKELKLAAIRDVLSGNYSIREATRKYHISSKSLLTRWGSKYTSGEEIKPTRTTSSWITMKEK